MLSENGGAREDTLEFLMVSNFESVDGNGKAEPQVTVRETTDPECPRCRRSLPVGANADHPDLCDRCAEVVSV
jgi:hypothetical protein